MSTARGFRFVSEQVSHHPPISACQGESAHWVFSQEATAETKFKATSLKIVPDGHVRVQLRSTGDFFEWKKVATSVEDIVSGNRWVDHFGQMIVVNQTTRDFARIDFTQSRFFF